MNRKTRGVTFYILLLVLLIVALRFINPPAEPVAEKDFTELITELKKDSVKSFDEKGREVTVETKKGEVFFTTIPQMAAYSFYDTYLKDKVENGGVQVIGNPTPTPPWYLEWIPNIFFIIVIIFIWYNFIQQSQGGGGKVMNFGKSKAKMVKKEDQKLITFSDVAGLQEEKEELEEIVEFLKEPKKFIDMGARIPKGVLLVGPPGTGKTYLSRAVAGEARVPFFIMSGSDFVEMFVGVGASRVRDLFENAKKNAPCIIFIDEIDAVGRRRGAGVGGGHDEREQTLNQLLVEMDGFGTNEGVIVMAATNRSDILDPALLRPGRFDRTVYVGRPDVRGREEILKIHSRKKILSADVDLKVIAKTTPGFTPADLENLMNEAALLAARKNRKEINMEDIEEATIKVQAGPAKRSKVVSEKERKLTAVHEAGHAVVSRMLPNHDPVHMVTIIPRGMAGGFTAYIPEDDVNFMTKGEMEDKLTSLMGGRVAESLVLDDISTGASNDIERATSIARAMVTQYGMSEKLGTITYGTDEEQIFVGRDFGRARNYSEEIASEIDLEMKRIINTAYKKAENIIKDNMETLLRISDALLERETLDREEFMKVFNGEELEPIEIAYTNQKIQKEDLSKEAAEIIEEEQKKDSEQ